MLVARPFRQVRKSRPSARRKLAEQEVAEPLGRVAQCCRSSRRARLGERGERQPVPGGDRLVVAAGCGRCRALREQARAQLRVELAADDRAAVLERLEQLGGDALVLRPRVRQPLDAVGVGVLRRGEAALRQREVAEQVLDTSPRRPAR